VANQIAAQVHLYYLNQYNDSHEQGNRKHAYRYAQLSAHDYHLADSMGGANVTFKGVSEQLVNC
jgi:hypothetical protein